MRARDKILAGHRGGVPIEKGVKMVGGQTYVKPAAFHAAVILAVLIEKRLRFGNW